MAEGNTLHATDIEDFILPGAIGMAIDGIARCNSPLLGRGRL